jgi:hypothetical protein
MTNSEKIICSIPNDVAYYTEQRDGQNTDVND